MDINVEDYGIFSKSIKAYYSLLLWKMPCCRYNFSYSKKGCEKVMKTIEKALSNFQYVSGYSDQVINDYFYLLVDSNMECKALRKKYRKIFNPSVHNEYNPFDITSPDNTVLNFYFISNMLSELSTSQLAMLYLFREIEIKTRYLNLDLYQDLLKMILMFRLKDIFKSRNGENERLEKHMFNQMGKIKVYTQHGVFNMRSMLESLVCTDRNDKEE